VTNLGNNPQEHEMLYHINYGAPLLEEGSRMLAPFHRIAPRDPRSTEGIDSYDVYGPPQIGFVEQAYLYQLAGTEDNRTLAMLQNAAGDRASLLRFTLEDFPCFTLWKNTAGTADGYVTGLEPATNYPNVRRFERERGRVISLEGGESRTTSISIGVLGSSGEVQAARKEIEDLQTLAEGKVLPKPDSSFSG
jgi:hypothetical protein